MLCDTEPEVFRQTDGAFEVVEVADAGSGTADSGGEDGDPGEGSLGGLGGQGGRAVPLVRGTPRFISSLAEP